MARQVPGMPVEQFVRSGNMANKLEQLETKVAELNKFLNQLNTDGFEVTTEVRGYTITVTATPPEDEEETDDEDGEDATSGT